MSPRKETGFADKQKPHSGYYIQDTPLDVISINYFGTYGGSNEQ